ncbi:AI-2E family transporter [Kineococcus terrestris]|uniref:AI-2E family transporter n=1 Tax=Kineococcus terrestris TaxID=2044856 RepID=UPI0034DAE355
MSDQPEPPVSERAEDVRSPEPPPGGRLRRRPFAEQQARLSRIRAARQREVHEEGTERPHQPPEQPLPQHVNAGAVLGRGITEASRWALRLLILGVAVAALIWLLARGWSLILPLVLALLLSAVLWPLAHVLRAVLPRALAALVALLALLVAVGGLFAALIPNIAGQTEEIADSAIAGLDSLQGFITGPPLNLANDEIGNLVDQGITELQNNAQNIALTVVGGVSTVGASIGSGIITAVLALVLTFFVLSGGDKMLPWSRRWLDAGTHKHAEQLGGRLWETLRGYIMSQAAVALVDAVFIGLGLLIVGVPLWLPLAVLIFFAGFIPIVGAIVTGILAVLIALVTLGWVQALIVLGIVLLVQQLESNVLQPFLVGRTLALHPVVVLSSVTIGGTLFGIVGAFLAVPVIAIITVTLRYLRSQLVPDPDETGPLSGASDVPGAVEPAPVGAAAPAPGQERPAGAAPRPDPED